MTVNPTPDKDDDMLAAEYALHLLSPAERAAFDDRLDVDGALRARLADWSERFAELADDIAAVDVPVTLRARLEKAVAAPPAFAPARQSGFSLARFFGGAVLALSIGVAVVTLLPDVRLPGALAPDFFAELATPEGTLLIAAAYSEASGELQIERSAGTPPPGRVFELWVIAEGNPVPVSLGVLPEAANAVVQVPEALRTVLPGAVLAISDEPPGGSPMEGPSGTVLATAALTEA